MKKNGMLGALLEDEVGKMRTRLWPELDFAKTWKNRRDQSSAGFASAKSHCQCFANGDRFGPALLLCGFATGCGKTHKQIRDKVAQIKDCSEKK